MYTEKSVHHFDIPWMTDEENRNRVDRVQFLLGHHKAMFMARHPHEYHWCGYVYIHPRVWNSIEDDVRRIAYVSYAGPSTQFTTWMKPNQDGKLTIETQLFPDATVPNFWVGFDLLRPKGEALVGDSEAYGELVGFQNLIERIKSGDITFRG